MLEPREWLRCQIEAFAPTRMKDERDAFYQKLRMHVSECPVPQRASDKTTDGYTSLLSIIWIACLQSESQDALNRRANRLDFARCGAKMSKEQKKIEQALRKFQKDRNVRFLHWELYEPAEVCCSHGRSRKDCEQLFKARDRLRLLDQPSLNSYLPKRVTELKKQYGHLLEQNADNFCEPRTLPATPLPLVREGQPTHELTDFLMIEIVAWLVNSGKKAAEAIRLLRDVLRLFFGVHSTEEAMKKRYQRLGSNR